MASMNLILFRENELACTLDHSDPHHSDLDRSNLDRSDPFQPVFCVSNLDRGDARAVHILKVLRRREGEEFDAGIINGPKGKGRVIKIEEDRLMLEFDLKEKPSQLFPVTLIIGLARPQIARRILREATALGVGCMDFFAADRGEKSYTRSRLWTNREYEAYVVEGAQQAFSTLLPAVRLFGSLEECLSQHANGMLFGQPDPHWGPRRRPRPLEEQRIALDNYEATVPLGAISPVQTAWLLAVGSERGWSSKERSLLRERGFTLAGLGDRVLGTETACVAGISLILAKGGFI